MKVISKFVSLLKNQPTAASELDILELYKNYIFPHTYASFHLEIHRMPDHLNDISNRILAYDFKGVNYQWNFWTIQKLEQN